MKVTRVVLSAVSIAISIALLSVSIIELTRNEY